MSGPITVQDSYVPNWLQHFGPNGRLLRGVEMDVNCGICGSKLAITRRPNRECEAFTVLPCGHVFGYECVSDWLDHNASCPTCRKAVRHGCGHRAVVWKIKGKPRFNYRDLPPVLAHGQTLDDCPNCLQFGRYGVDAGEIPWRDTSIISTITRFIRSALGLGGDNDSAEQMRNMVIIEDIFDGNSSELQFPLELSEFESPLELAELQFPLELAASDTSEPPAQDRPSRTYDADVWARTWHLPMSDRLTPSAEDAGGDDQSPNNETASSIPVGTENWSGSEAMPEMEQLQNRARFNNPSGASHGSENSGNATASSPALPGSERSIPNWSSASTPVALTPPPPSHPVGRPASRSPAPIFTMSRDEIRNWRHPRTITHRFYEQSTTETSYHYSAIAESHSTRDGGPSESPVADNGNDDEREDSHSRGRTRRR